MIEYGGFGPHFLFTLVIMAFEWGLLGLFFVCFLAATIIPFPSETAVLFFLQSGDYSTTWILVIASLGNCIGGSTNYFLGYFGRKILSKKQFLKSESVVQKYGFWSAAFSWVPIIGDPLLILLGIYKVSLGKTMLLMCFGKVARYIAVFGAYWSFT
jgi:membrane protein YqaA with SNARE-associated domain